MRKAALSAHYLLRRGWNRRSEMKKSIRHAPLGDGSVFGTIRLITRYRVRGARLLRFLNATPPSTLNSLANIRAAVMHDHAHMQRAGTPIKAMQSSCAMHGSRSGARVKLCAQWSVGDHWRTNAKSPRLGPGALCKS